MTFEVEINVFCFMTWLGAYDNQGVVDRMRSFENNQYRLIL